MKRIFTSLALFLITASIPISILETTKSSTNILVNGDFETGDLTGWSANFAYISTKYHNGSYSVYVSDDLGDTWISQDVNVSINHELAFEGWVYPTNTGPLDGYYPSSGFDFWFSYGSSKQPVFAISYRWCWSEYCYNTTHYLQFCLPLNKLQFNLISRNVTHDVRSYFTGFDLSDIVLDNITAYFHYSEESPGPFYVDDLKLLARSPLIVVPDDYSTIQEAINHANSGDTVFVRNGVYYESKISVNKPLRILGESSNYVVLSGGIGVTHIFNVTSDDVLISGFRFVNTRSWAAIVASSVNDLVISENYFYDHSTGILGEKCFNTTIMNNVFEGCQVSGIHMDFSSYGFIEGNILHNTTSVSRNQHGIWLNANSSYFMILRNLVTHCTSAAVFLDGSNNNTITENKIRNNRYGIYFSKWYQLNPSENTFYHNNFTQNNDQVLIEDHSSFNSSWDSGYPSGGNYWSDYTGSDINNDGIGDTPYIVDANNTDYYPLMKPYGGIHDIGITNVSALKTVICQGYSMKDALRIINYGIQSETFNVSVKVKSTTLNSWTTTLTSRNSIAITINTTFDGFMLAKGNHTIDIFATPVPNETYTSDDNYSFWIIVSMVGDISSEETGYPDGRCDMSDVYVVCKRFGKFYPNPEYVPNYDIDNDGRIDMSDIYIVCRNFGKIDP